MPPLTLKYHLYMLSVDPDLQNGAGDKTALRENLLSLAQAVREARTIKTEDEAYNGFLRTVGLVLEGSAVVAYLLKHVTDVNQRQSVLTLVNMILESLGKQTIVFVHEL